MKQHPRPTIIDGIPDVGPARGTPFRMLVASLIAAFLLAFLASRGLPAWADAKGSSEAAMALGDLSERWADGLERLGFTGPHDAVRKLVRKVELTRW
jgi:hypothetical protein